VSVSIQRIQIEAPGLTESPVMVADIDTLQEALFPFVAPAALAHALPGELKFRAAKLTKLPVFNPGAVVL
jgi:hypothetical protein